METEFLTGEIKGYSQVEIALLSDDEVKGEWEAICQAYRLRLQQYLNQHNGLMLFANFVNFASEMDKRKLK